MRTFAHLPDSADHITELEKTIGTLRGLLADARRDALDSRARLAQIARIAAGGSDIPAEQADIPEAGC